MRFPLIVVKAKSKSAKRLQIVLLASNGGIPCSQNVGMKQTYGVLVVDDSEDDRYLLRKAFDQLPRFKLLRELSDGKEAVSYLLGQGQFAQRELYPLPDLVVLDLNMPGMRGHDVLRWLRT